MTTEAKVGSFTILALALFSYMLVYLNGWGTDGDRYEVEAVFDRVDGLKPGNLVRFAGVEVGSIQSVEPMEKGAKARLLIRQGVHIPENSVIGIGSDGLMGEKFINILPPAEDPGNPLPPGAVVSGRSQQGIEQLMEQTNLVLKDMHQLISSMNAMFGDPEVQRSLVASAVNIRELTENLNRMSSVLTHMAVTNEADVRNMVQNLNQMSASMMQAAARVDRMLEGIDNNGETVADIRAAVANLNATSKRVERMAAALEDVVTDPKTSENIKQTLQNARNVTEKADRMMRRVSEIETDFSTEVLYSGGSDRFMTNANLKIKTSPHDFILMGVSDIGEENKTNLQIGSGSDKFTGRAGLMESKAGIGVDAKLSRDFQLSVDAYDPNDFRVKLRAEYALAPDTFLIGQTNNINKSQERESFVGIRRSF